tara:strand:- start:4000 stop:4362 length:363 start_codon:yes stop_codon:yes gene_type:complete
METEKEVVKGKGRPSREDSTTTQIITDPLMEPFYIRKDPLNFTVYEKSISTRGFGGKKASGNEVEKVVGYYTSFGSALRTIAKAKFSSHSGDYTSIKEYINEWDNVKDGLSSLVGKVEGI